MAMTTTPLRRNPPRRAREVPVQLTANLADSASELDHEWVSPKAIKSARPTRPRKAGAVRIVGDGQPLTRKLCRSRPASSDDGFPLGDGAVRTIEPSLGQCRLPINMHQFTDAAELRGVHAALLGWYVTHQRAMPWRIPYRPDHDSEPAAVDLDQRGYEVWVSEIMLQQTQVATVREYYRRWMIEFPTVQALAAAPLDRVYQLWAGLGYYSRAKRLHEGATFLVKENSGSLPRDAATLMKAVPGVGRYTAGAVASIAFGRPEPLVDGNVVRVLTRLRAWGGDVTKASGVRWTWDTAAELLHQSAPGHWNQALMELGATVCTPTKPKCETCPLVEFCHAYTQLHDKPRYWELAGKRRRDVPDIEDCGLCTFPAGPQLWPNMSHYPQKPAKKVARQEETTVYIIEVAKAGSASKDQDTRLLFTKRPMTGLLANLWEPVTISVPAGTAACSGPSDLDQTSDQPFPLARKEAKALRQHTHGAAPVVLSTLFYHYFGSTYKLSDATRVQVRVLDTVRHIFTHIHMHYRPVHLRMEVDGLVWDHLNNHGHRESDELAAWLPPSSKWAREAMLAVMRREYQWVAPAQIDSLALSTAMVKVLQAVRQPVANFLASVDLSGPM